MPVNYTDQHRNIIPKSGIMAFTAQQQPTDASLDLRLTLKRGIMPHPINLASYTRLVRLWILQDKLLLAGS